MAVTVAASPVPAITGRDALLGGDFSTSSWHLNDDVGPDGKSLHLAAAGGAASAAGDGGELEGARRL